MPSRAWTAPSVDAAFASFVRFPRWMWTNPTFRAFAHGLRQSNDGRAPDTPPVTIHGMDLYDVQGSASAVIDALEAAEAAEAAGAAGAAGATGATGAAARARSSYACLESTVTDSDGVARARTPRWPDVGLLRLGSSRRSSSLRPAPSRRRIHRRNRTRHFDLLQHARNVVAGEAYLRAMHEGREEPWDIRDRHMVSTVDLLLAALDHAEPQKRSRLVVWAHNAHVGDMGATSRGDAGRVSIGQLLRERYPGEVAIVGLMTAVGTVRAAVEWGGPDRVMTLTPPRRGSHADLLQRTGGQRFYKIPNAGSTEFTVISMGR